MRGRVWPVPLTQHRSPAGLPTAPAHGGVASSPARQSTSARAGAHQEAVAQTSHVGPAKESPFSRRLEVEEHDLHSSALAGVGKLVTFAFSASYPVPG